MAVLSEWTPDYTSAERQALGDVTLRHGGLVTLMGEHVFAQLEAGLVPAPSFLSTPKKASSR